ncbi:major histocompatibility complex class I-related gene protein-like [Liasis olivaceus]
MEPLVPWMEEVESGTFLAPEWVFRADLQRLSELNPQAGGLHIWQAILGCEQNGSKGGFFHYGYNGTDFISFNKETLKWVAAQPQAEKVKEKWDDDLLWSQRNKDFLEKSCIAWLHRYLSRRREPLQRTGSHEFRRGEGAVGEDEQMRSSLLLNHLARNSTDPVSCGIAVSAEAPVVTVSSRTEADDGMETHVCRMDGFYPKEIDASWRRDGEVRLQDCGSVAPNADGTYHYWLSIRIDPKERDHYRCHVEHDGLQEPLAVAVKVPESNLGVIVGCVVAAVVLVIIGIVWILVYRSKYPVTTFAGWL